MTGMTIKNDPSYIPFELIPIIVALILSVILITAIFIWVP